MRNTIVSFAAFGLLLSACTPPVEAPEDFGALTLYMYQHFDAEAGDELVASVVSLEAYFATLDASGSLDDRSVTLPRLTTDFLGGVTAPPDAAATAQVPVGVTALSNNDLATSLDLIGEANQVCIANNGYVFYMRDSDGDLASFLDGSGDSFTSVAEIRYESLIANAWFDEFQDFRRFELDDGRTVVFERAWAEEQFMSDNGSASWDQRFAFSVWLPDADDTSKTWRFLAFWSSADLPGIGDDSYASLAVDGIEEGFVNEEAYVAGDTCANDRDATFDRP